MRVQQEPVGYGDNMWNWSAATGRLPASPRHPQQPVRRPVLQAIVKWEFFCSDGTLTFNVTWADNSNNETGYRVFRNGEQAAELPANSTSYSDNVAVSGDQSLEYYIQVYSPTGTANSGVMRMKCSI